MGCIMVHHIGNSPALICGILMMLDDVLVKKHWGLLMISVMFQQPGSSHAASSFDAQRSCGLRAHGLLWTTGHKGDIQTLKIIFH